MVKIMLLAIVFILFLLSTPEEIRALLIDRAFPYSDYIFLFAVSFLIVHFCSQMTARFQQRQYIREVMRSLDPAEKVVLRMFQDQQTSTLIISPVEHPAVLALKDKRVLGILGGRVQNASIAVALLDVFRKAVHKLPPD